MTLTTIIFDLDDTLIDTGPLYDTVIEESCALIEHAVPAGPGFAAIRRLQEKLDISGVHQFGFSTDRFPWSLAETYRAVTRQAGAPVRSEVERELERLGHSVYDTVPELIVPARELLTELGARYELMLYTLGVEKLQRRKIEHHGLQELVREVHIVGEKSADQLRRIIGERDPAVVLVVGDSLRGEVAPAVAVGCRAVFIKRPSAWSYHEVPVNGPYHTINELGELPALLARL